ncbi:MAG: TetR/AcrR family transcriptional regulator [Clostridia bacterium]|nr:TetR/AcrR family transcriptional regulator [Clostridia bacterium]
MNKSESKYFNTAVKMDLALISLLKKKSFEYITVKELCEAAGVNRSTFYLHYETIGDLLEETTAYLTDGFVSYFDVDSANFVRNISNREPSELNFINDEYLTPYLTYIKENKEVFATALLNGKSFGFEKVYNRMFQHIFNPILEKFHYPEGDRKYVIRYYLNGITAIVSEWLKDGCEKSISDLVKIIEECVFGLENKLLQSTILFP